MAISVFSLTLVALAVVGPYFYNAINHHLTVLGVHRSPDFVSSGEGIHKIEDTMQCEDIHYYSPGNVIFAACEDSILPRFAWFPPLGHFDKLPDTTGSIHIIGPQTLKSHRLKFENFAGPFVTHGIDVITDPEKSDAVYIFAVNHLANPEYVSALTADPSTETDIPKARSQVEIFHHVLKSNSVRHVRSVQHELVKTPNDLYAASPNSFYVTNDHYYKHGRLRQVEDMVPWLKWTNVIHVQVDRLTGVSGDASAGVNATVALPNLWAANGLGHGPNDEILVSSVLGGTTKRTVPSADGRTLSVKGEIAVDSTIDNPSYFADPYATADDDASGYVFGGLRRAIDMMKTASDPEATEAVIVWYVRKKAGSQEWETKVLFEDDGSNIRSSSAALLVPVDPATTGGVKEAWLFVTGFISPESIAIKVQL
ncbi:serum paraoxonase/arylesterase family protein [Aspergillus stella-maris]|uniref:serum paraoxonase/arylesterase family protein n=1 Tax=Aspergillus stella-maris TaxID=1810926 RepID=UPI003CCDE769